VRTLEINKKEYKITTDISFGTLEDSQKNPDDTDSMKAMIKEILDPVPTDEEIRAMKMSQIMDVIKEFGRLQEEQNIDFKKKLLR